MTDFATRFAARGAPRLLTAFGEEVIYTPIRGVPRTITAMVTRNPPQEVSEGARTPYLIIDCYDDRDTGIVAADIKVMQDTIEVSNVVGDSAKVKHITQVLDSGRDGMVKVSVQ